MNHILHLISILKISFSLLTDLIHLTLRTMALLKRNQMLQKRLTALQKETRAFVTSALKEQQQQHQQQQLATMMEHSVPRG